LGEVVVNIVFDLGGVVVTWEPEAIIAHVFADPMVQALVHTAIFRHADWLALDRGMLPWQEAVKRGAHRTGLSEAEVATLLQQVPPSLVAIPGTVDLLYRLKAQGHTLFCLSNMHVASIAHLEQAYTFWDVFTGVVISCRLHLCKPESALYAYLLETYGLEGAHTVFIDDTEANLAAAAQFGMESREMLGIIGKLRENGLHHARTAHTRRSPAMRVQPAMEVEERPDAASSPGSPCSPMNLAFPSETGSTALKHLRNFFPHVSWVP
jgi:putative hydrolase of the HAD superfamily